METMGIKKLMVLISARQKKGDRITTRKILLVENEKWHLFRVKRDDGSYIVIFLKTSQEVCLGFKTHFCKDSDEAILG